MKIKFPIISIKQAISIGILTAYFFYAGKAVAQTSQYTNDSSFEIELNYRTATELDALISRGSMIYIDRVDGIIWNWETPDAFGFTMNPPVWESSPAELMPLQNIIGDIKNNSIDSYGALVGRADSLSDNQKLALLAATGEILGRYSYDYGSDTDYSMLSQDEMFIRLQDSLVTGNQNPLGVCRQIHSHIEALANDIGTEAATVSAMSTSWRGADRGDGHAITIARTPESMALIDYDTIMMTDTKNVEELLGAYQKIQGGIELEHQFYENNEFKYRFITKDGRKFLDFLGYNESLSRMKDFMLYSPNDFFNMHDSRSRVAYGLYSQQPRITLNIAEYETSMELNSMYFVNGGRIRGSSSSPMDRADLVQFGIKGLVHEEEEGKVEINASLFYGQLEQDSDAAGNDLWGGIFHIALATDREGFNHVLRFSLPSINVGDLGDYSESQYNEIVLGAGLSYRFVTEALDIEPYVAAQIPLEITSHSPYIEGYYKQFDTYEGDLQVSEFGTGVQFACRMPKDLKLSVEPHFISRIWEDELGANLTLGREKWGVYLGAGKTDSNYEFCPDSNRINLGWYSDIGGWNFRARYELLSEDYGKETDTQHALITVSKRF